MRALDPEVKAIIWQAIEPLLPITVETHPLGRHRRRKSNRDCFEVMLVRLVTGCSWEDAERLCHNKVSDTTVRKRRDEWVEAGVFDRIANEAIAAFDRVIGLELADVALDGSLHKSPCGGEGTGKNPTDRGRLGWKWSILTDLRGIPFGWTIEAANRNDSILFAPTLDDAIIARKPKPGSKEPKTNQPMGLRWPVERTNSWLSSYGQLRRNTDRRTVHRLAQFALAIAFLLTAKLIDYRNRWSRDLSPIG